MAYGLRAIFPGRTISTEKGAVITTLIRRTLLIRRLSWRIPRDLLLPLIDGLISSKIRYGLPVYGRVRLREEDPSAGWQKRLSNTE